MAVDPALTAGLYSKGLQGTYTVAQALQALLDGQPVEAVAHGEGGYWLRRREITAVLPSDTATVPTLAEVTVTARGQHPVSDERDNYRGGAVSLGVLGNRAPLDTPYSIEVVTRGLMDNQQAESLVDALRNDASVTPISNNIGGLSSQIAVRGVGLDLLSGRKVDGLNIFGWSGDLPLEHFEQIQLLKGAGGFLYGFAQPGGIVNFIGKRPTDAPLRSGYASVTDSGTFLLAGDLGGRFGPDDRFGYRTTVVGEQGDTYVRDGGRIKRASGSLALDWRVLPQLVWQADVLAVNRRVTGSSTWGIFPNASGSDTDVVVAQPPAPIPGSRRIFSPFTRYETRATLYGTGVEWALTDDWRASLRYRGSSMTRVYLNGSIFANAAGDYTEVQYAGTDRFETSDVQALVTGKARTGGILHDLTFGVSYGRIRTFYASGSDAVVLGSGNLASPGHFANPGLSAPPADALGSDTIQRAVFASDTLHVGDHLDVVLGVRHNGLEDTVNGYDRGAATPTAAVVLKPAPWLSFYTSYVEALEQGATAPLSAANAQQVFAPLRTRQVEAGIKAERARWSASAAVFRIRRGLTYTDADNVFTQDGEARYDGIELQGRGWLTPRWQVIGSVMFLDARNVATTPGLTGQRVDGTPRQQAKLYGEYRLADTGFTLTGGIQYYGARPIDAANTAHVAGYTLFDAGIRYETRRAGTRTTVRLNIDNLAGKAYWLTSASYLTQGAPRTFRLSAQLDF
ncbi:TonB-dependent siderophore receptor [Cupriavidus agavae]|uniref:Iron complex outermembrane receptor protein n=1 Tax=Cupriavidus agavae TaxID=1001822 RepID=A0A4Q7RTE0_9BURK|nr:TonB-dependent receptor [Cupriavidus agavae]RZT36873.1 iron complex outermembrane receptor protein [Cupriavidus agavae]